VREKHGDALKGKVIIVTWPKENSHHDGHKNAAAAAPVTAPVTVMATAVVDARTQTHYPAAKLRLATVIFRVHAETGHDAFLA
jgi:hypothetical protein